MVISLVFGILRACCIYRLQARNMLQYKVFSTNSVILDASISLIYLNFSCKEILCISVLNVFAILVYNTD